MKILISGFEAFGPHSSNITQKLITSLDQGKVKIPDNVLIQTITLPVEFEKSFRALESIYLSFKPDVILAFGLADKRGVLEIERVALNFMDAEIPDNGGFKPRDKKIYDQGQTAYFSTLPFRELVQVLEDNGHKCGLSNSAGTYVCNDLFYRMMNMVEAEKVKAGFIHVPGTMNVQNLNAIVEIWLNYFSKGW